MSIKDKIKNAKESHLFDELSEKEKFEAIVEAKVKVRLIAEFEEIKAEMQGLCHTEWDTFDKVVRLDKLNNAIDTHIKELKGE